MSVACPSPPTLRTAAPRSADPLPSRRTAQFDNIYLSSPVLSTQPGSTSHPLSLEPHAKGDQKKSRL